MEKIKEGDSGLSVRKKLNELIDLSKKKQNGLQNGNSIPLIANEPSIYALPNNSFLFALIVETKCSIKIGSEAGLDDLGDIDNKGVVQLGFISKDIYLTANKNVELTPIIYKFKN